MALEICFMLGRIFGCFSAINQYTEEPGGSDLLILLEKLNMKHLKLGKRETLPSPVIGNMRDIGLPRKLNM